MSIVRIGDQEIMHGNCLEVLRKPDLEPLDVVVTSPPYNLNLAYGMYDDARTEKDYVNWIADVATAIKRVLKPDGSFFLNLSGSNSRPYVPFEVLVKLRNDVGFHLQNHITWIKSIGIGCESSGHFKPVPGHRFMHHNHEHIFHLTHDNDVRLDRLSIGIPFQDKSNIARRGHSRDLRCRGNTWFIPYPTVKSKAQKYWHPATFPVELPLWCIYLHGRPGARVLDPFLGTGTTLVAAHLAGAEGVGIDIDPTYIATARQRLTDVVQGSRRVVLDRSEMEHLFRSDAAQQDGAAWRRRTVAFQERLNKTTGELVLNDGDVDWITRNASRPTKHCWQNWIAAAFARHVDLERDDRRRNRWRSDLREQTLGF
jgi:site-specific DNA-methyltransferase (adenine-specific)